MKQLHFFSFAAVVAMLLVPAISQGQAASAPMPPMAAAAAVDCGKAPMKRHDHSAERGGGGSSARAKQMIKPCPPDAAASASPSTAKKKMRHDHTATKTM